MNKHVITGLFLLAAIVCYLASLNGAAMVLILLGIIFETIFWFRVFIRPDRHESK